jgi:acyl transferase domain-containing protein
LICETFFILTARRTQAGDPNEVQALRKAICEGRDPQNLLHLTSIKANIGHCEAASGAAALAKVILMMKHGMIPPQISLQTLNPKIQNLGSDGAVINRNGALWNRQGGHPRTALINNFGAAGSNVGLILQEYRAQERQQETSSFTQQRSYTLGFSAKKKEALVSLRDALIQALAAESIRGDLRDICYTLTARRQLYDHRISVTASSIPQLVERLQQVQSDFIPKSQNDPAEAVFVFSGQGSQVCIHTMPKL